MRPNYITGTVASLGIQVGKRKIQAENISDDTLAKIIGVINLIAPDFEYPVDDKRYRGELSIPLITDKELLLPENFLLAVSDDQIEVQHYIGDTPTRVRLTRRQRKELRHCLDTHALKQKDKRQGTDPDHLRIQT